MTQKRFDKIIIGAGLYGLYAALFCVERRQNVVVLECERAPFTRATFINQARVHQGYHYPRSISTAMKSAGYFDKFCRDYSFCIDSEFDQIYATSSKFSWCDGKQFRDFCNAVNIPCKELHSADYFKEGMGDGVFLVKEYTYDAMILRDYYMEKLSSFDKLFQIDYGVNIVDIKRNGNYYIVKTEDGNIYESDFILNATYAGVNQILDKVGFEKFKIKYELCEIILCDVNDNLKNVGFTVMDGPFFL